MENKILEISNRRKSYEIKYNDLIIEFITKAYELVELSNEVYQVEKTIKLNKISLKDFILNSDICNILKNNNIKDYTISELKKYFAEYEKELEEKAFKLGGCNYFAPIQRTEDFLNNVKSMFGLSKEELLEMMQIYLSKNGVVKINSCKSMEIKEIDEK